MTTTAIVMVAVVLAVALALVAVAILDASRVRQTFDSEPGPAPEPGAPASQPEPGTPASQPEPEPEPEPGAPASQPEPGTPASQPEPEPGTPASGPEPGSVPVPAGSSAEESGIWNFLNNENVKRISAFTVAAYPHRVHIRWTLTSGEGRAFLWTGRNEYEPVTNVYGEIVRTMPVGPHTFTLAIYREGETLSQEQRSVDVPCAPNFDLVDGECVARPCDSQDGRLYALNAAGRCRPTPSCVPGFEFNQAAGRCDPLPCPPIQNMNIKQIRLPDVGCVSAGTCLDHHVNKDGNISNGCIPVDSPCDPENNIVRRLDGDGFCVVTKDCVPGYVPLARGPEREIVGGCVTVDYPCDPPYDIDRTVLNRRTENGCVPSIWCIDDNHVWEDGDIQNRRCVHISEPCDPESDPATGRLIARDGDGTCRPIEACVPGRQWAVDPGGGGGCRTDGEICSAPPGDQRPHLWQGVAQGRAACLPEARVGDACGGPHRSVRYEYKQLPAGGLQCQPAACADATHVPRDGDWAQGCVARDSCDHVVSDFVVLRNDEGLCVETPRCRGDLVPLNGDAALGCVPRTTPCEERGNFVGQVRNSQGICVNSDRCVSDEYVFSRDRTECRPRNPDCPPTADHRVQAADEFGDCLPKSPLECVASHVPSGDGEACVDKTAPCEYDPAETKFIHQARDATGACVDSDRCVSDEYVFSRDRTECRPRNPACPPGADNKVRAANAFGECVPKSPLECVAPHVPSASGAACLPPVAEEAEEEQEEGGGSGGGGAAPPEPGSRCYAGDGVMGYYYSGCMQVGQSCGAPIPGAGTRRVSPGGQCLLVCTPVLNGTRDPDNECALTCNQGYRQSAALPTRCEIICPDPATEYDPSTGGCRFKNEDQDCGTDRGYVMRYRGGQCLATTEWRQAGAQCGNTQDGFIHLFDSSGGCTVRTADCVLGLEKINGRCLTRCGARETRHPVTGACESEGCDDGYDLMPNGACLEKCPPEAPDRVGQGQCGWLYERDLCDPVVAGVAETDGGFKWEFRKRVCTKTEACRDDLWPWNGECKDVCHYPMTRDMATGDCVPLEGVEIAEMPPVLDGVVEPGGAYRSIREIEFGGQTYFSQNRNGDHWVVDAIRDTGVSAAFLDDSLGRDGFTVNARVMLRMSDGTTKWLKPGTEYATLALSSTDAVIPLFTMSGRLYMDGPRVWSTGRTRDNLVFLVTPGKIDPSVEYITASAAPDPDASFRDADVVMIQSGTEHDVAFTTVPIERSWGNGHLGLLVAGLKYKHDASGTLLVAVRQSGGGAWSYMTRDGITGTLPRTTTSRGGFERAVVEKEWSGGRER
eukprot:jgi/Tetstr1/454048/TSEL_040967.t1